MNGSTPMRSPLRAGEDLFNKSTGANSPTGRAGTASQAATTMIAASDLLQDVNQDLVGHVAARRQRDAKIEMLLQTVADLQRQVGGLQAKVDSMHTGGSGVEKSLAQEIAARENLEKNTQKGLDTLRRALLQDLAEAIAKEKAEREQADTDLGALIERHIAKFRESLELGDVPMTPMRQ
eukprot:tig00020723_g13487.t1